MQTGITTAVLKGANAPVAKDANGETVGDQSSELQAPAGLTRSTEAFTYETSGPIPYTRCTPSGDVVCRGEAG
jgi:hypothetical protein